MFFIVYILMDFVVIMFIYFFRESFEVFFRIVVFVVFKDDDF